MSPLAALRVSIRCVRSAPNSPETISTNPRLSLLSSPVAVRGENRVPTFTQGAISLLARWLISIIFLTSAYSKIFGWSANVDYMNSKHMPAVTFLLVSALVVEIAGSICLITGLAARAAATVMFFYMVPVTFLLHDFMSVNFQTKLGIMGGLLMIAAFGTGRIALEARVAVAPATN